MITYVQETLYYILEMQSYRSTAGKLCAGTPSCDIIEQNKQKKSRKEGTDLKLRGNNKLSFESY